jgi:hypothetical protein
VVELFVFVRMGGMHEDVVVKLVGSNTTHLAEGLRHFDAAKAKCFLDGDRQRLLAVIEASFGTLAPFNTMVREIFVDSLNRISLGLAQTISLPVTV